MNPTEEDRVREAMIPHLQATMAMGWAAPPSRIAGLTLGLDSGFDSGGGSAEATQFHALGHEAEGLIRRCGATVVASVLAMVGARKAGAEKALLWADMVAIQTAMLGREAGFRRGDARTTVREERYAVLRDLEPLFSRKLEADAADSTHEVLKGIRLYLDLIFVHPFEDGNARAALLWLAYFFWRADRPLPRLASLTAFDFRAGDKSCYWDFAELALSP